MFDRKIDPVLDPKFEENRRIVAVSKELYRMRREMKEEGYLLWSEIPWLK